VARNIDRKELKHPDQFVSFWTRVAAWISAHRLKVLGGAGGLVVAGFAIWGISGLMAKKAAESSLAFARIEKIANAELLPEKGEPPKKDDGLPHFKTEESRLEAALKEVNTFLGAHGSSALKDEALLLKAKYLLALGKSSEALAIYQGQLGGVDPHLRFIASEGLAYAQEAAGQIDAALAAFNALAEEAQKAGGFYADRALFHKARLLEKKGSGKDAETVLRDILTKTPTTPLREEINDRLAALEGK
jgi:tetratricopeptide (TPR) repeat protein